MLTISHVSKSFGSVAAVSDLSFEIAPGEIFGLLGPNGAGKTTTVKLAVGLLQPDKGRVSLAGLGTPDDPRVRSQIGIAPQMLSIYEDLSGDENLAFFGRLLGLRGRNLSDRVDWALDFVDLGDRRKSAVRTYSGGMKRRLNLAVAVIHKPPLLLLDEPTAGVDPQSRNSIFEKILDLRKSGCTIVYTTHYMEEAQKLCDRVGIMDRGKLLDLGTVEDLTLRHGGKSVLTAEKGERQIRIETDDPIRDLTDFMSQGSLRSFSLERPDLEAVFLNLTGRQLRD